jgi:hypothetical protein
MNRTSTLKSRLRLAFLPFFLAVGLLVNQQELMAQPPLSRDVVYEYEEYLSNLLGSEDPLKIAEGVRLHELVESYLPTVFLYGGNISTPMGEEAPIISVDQVSMGKIASSVAGYNKDFVELVSITLSDPSDPGKRINTVALGNVLKNVKYLLFTFTYPLCDPSDSACEIQKVKDLLLGPGNPKLVILYRVSIPM